MRQYFLYFIGILVFVEFGFSEDALQIGYVDIPPYEYDEKGQAKGFATRLIREACKIADIEISFVYLPWIRAMNMIKHGQLDCLYIAIKTPEREVFADYSNEVLVVETTIILSRKESGYSFDGDLNALKQEKIGLVRGYRYGPEIDRAINSSYFDHLDYSGEPAVSLRKLIDGRVEFLIGDKLAFLDLARRQNVLNRVKEVGTLDSSDSYLIFSKKRNLVRVRDEFDAALRRMKDDGTYQAILNGND